MDAAALRPDCQNCAALCCIAFAFDRAQGFPVDKANGEPCPNLVGKDHCAIYETREQAGFGACLKYDCNGAGQRVTQDLFDGAHWRDAPAVLPSMIAAFVTMEKIHAALSLLQSAAALPLDAAEQGRVRALQERLDPPEGWTADALAEFDAGAATRAVQRFLGTLKHRVNGVT